MRVRKVLISFFALILFGGLFVIPTWATPVNNNAPFTIVQGSIQSGQLRPYYPSITKGADGTLILAYWEATQHAPQNESQHGKIYVRQSTNNGASWSGRTEVMSTAKLASLGITTNNGSRVGGGEPNLTTLNDGTIVMTFWTTRDGKGRNAKDSEGEMRTYIMYSTNNGTSWSNPTRVETMLTDMGGERLGHAGKRGDIAVLDNPNTNEMLIPLYGSARTEHRRIVAVRAFLSHGANKQWRFEPDVVVAQGIGELSLTEMALVVPEGQPNTVFAMIRQENPDDKYGVYPAAANIRRSTDRGKTWHLYSSTLSPEQKGTNRIGKSNHTLNQLGGYHQPGFTKLPGGKIFVTYVLPNIKEKHKNSTTRRDQLRRPIYGMIFDPTTSWAAACSTEKKIYEETSTNSGNDMGSGSTVYTNDGRFLTVWYNAITGRLQGKYSNPKLDWKVDIPKPQIEPIKMSGVAKDVQSGTNQGTLGTNTQITNKVTLTNLKSGTYYAIIGALYNATDGEFVKATTAVNPQGGHPSPGAHAKIPGALYVEMAVPSGGTTREVNMTFPAMNSQSLAGKTIIVFQYLYETGTRIGRNNPTASLANSADVNQAIYYRSGQATATPVPSTSIRMSGVARDVQSGTNQGTLGTNTQIANRVTLTNLKSGTYYAIIGALYNATDGEFVKATTAVNPQGGHPSPGAHAKIPGALYVEMAVPSGGTTREVNMTFPAMNSQSLAGKTIIVFQYLYETGTNIGRNNPTASLANSADANQAIYYRSVQATATPVPSTSIRMSGVARDVQSGTNQGTLGTNTQIANRVTLTNLKSGTYYAIIGALYNATDGEFVKSTTAVSYPHTNGHPSPGAHSKIPGALYVEMAVPGSGTTREVNMTFPAMNSQSLAGKTIIVFQYLYETGTNIGRNNPTASLANSADASQAIFYGTASSAIAEPMPMAATSIQMSGVARDVQSGNNQGTVGTNTQITNKVTLRNLKSGTYYAIIGALYNATDGEFVKATTAVNAQGGHPSPGAHSKIPGALYVEMAVPGSGTTREVNMTFPAMNSQSLAGKTIVVFQYLYETGTKIGRNNPTTSLANLADANQTIYYGGIQPTATPRPSTTIQMSGVARDVQSGGHQGTLGTNTQIANRVTLTNLKSGTYYAIIGALYNVTDGEFVKSTTAVSYPHTNGHPSPGAHAKIPGALYVEMAVPGSGTTREVNMTFPAMNSQSLAGKTIVVFQYLYETGTKIGRNNPTTSLANLADANQTIYYGGIQPTATPRPTVTPRPSTTIRMSGLARDVQSGGHQGTVGTNTQVANRVTLTNLKSGTYYAIIGALYNVTDGEFVKSTTAVSYPHTDGHPSPGAHAKIPGALYVEMAVPGSGTTREVNMTFPAMNSQSLAGKTIVVFQYLYETGTKIGRNNPTTMLANVSDVNQTIYYAAAPTATPRPTAAPTATPRPTAAPTATPRPTAAPTATPRPTATPTSIATPIPIVTATPIATPIPIVTATPVPTVTPSGTYLTLSRNRWEPSNAAQSTTIDVMTNYSNWGVSKDFSSQWLTCSRAGNSVVISVEANLGTTVRTGYVYINASGPGSTYEIILVTQRGISTFVARSAAPIMESTHRIPSATPVETPMITPTEAPVETPVIIPVETPTVKPIEMTVIAPTEMPIETEAPIVMPTEEPDKLILSETELKITNKAQMAEVTVETNLESWSMETLDEWLVLVRTENGFEVQVKENPSKKVREGTIIVKAGTLVEIIEDREGSNDVQLQVDSGNNIQELEVQAVEVVEAETKVEAVVKQIIAEDGSLIQMITVKQNGRNR